MRKNVVQKKVSQPVNQVSKVHVPLYVKETIDVIINKMSYDDVAKKYNRTKNQVYWLSSKCGRVKFQELWKRYDHSRKTKSKMNIPFYMIIASEALINNCTIEQIANIYKKSVSSIKKIFNTSLKKNLTYMWELMNKQGFTK